MIQIKNKEEVKKQIKDFLSLKDEDIEALDLDEASVEIEDKFNLALDLLTDIGLYKNWVEEWFDWYDSAENSIKSWDNEILRDNIIQIKDFVLNEKYSNTDLFEKITDIDLDKWNSYCLDKYYDFLHYVMLDIDERAEQVTSYKDYKTSILKTLYDDFKEQLDYDKFEYKEDEFDLWLGKYVEEQLLK